MLFFPRHSSRQTGTSARGRSQSALLACLTVLAVLVGCKGEPESVATAESEAVAGPGTTAHGEAEDSPRQTAFRVRSDFAADLNASTGWAAGLNEEAVVVVDQPFRIRFEVEQGAGAAETRFSLQARRNQGSWQTLEAEDFPYPLKQQRVRSDWQVTAGGESAPKPEQVKGADGHLRFLAREVPLLALGTFAAHWEPVELTAVMRLPEGGRAGVVFAWEDTDNHHRLDVLAGRGLRLVRVTQGRERVLRDQKVEVVSGDWIELKLERDGSALKLGYEWDPHVEGLEFSVNLDGNLPMVPAGLLLPPGQSADLQYLDIEGETSTPGVSIVSAPGWDHGSPATDLLTGSRRPYTAGTGIDFAGTTPPWRGQGAQGEWEFPLVIRNFFDGPDMHEAGDVFQFRLVDIDGRPVPSETPVTVTLHVPERHLGGVFVETPGRVGPWEAANGDLYFLQEPAETDNRMMTLKSEDGGLSWREVDGAHRPQTGDLEGVAQVQAGDRIHTLHQTSEHVFYHVFRTSDHPTHPDSWETVDELLASPVEPPVQVADLALRSDGSVVAVYGSPERLLLRNRSAGGEWGEEIMVDGPSGRTDSGPVMILGSDDVVHLAYTGRDGTAWYRQVLPDGTLTRAQQVASGLGTTVEAAGGILPLVHLPASDSVSLIYRLDNGELWERRADAEGKLSAAVQVTHRPVVTNAADSEQVGADAVGYDDGVQVLFIEEGSKRLFHVSRQGEGDWGDEKLLVDDSKVLWVRGNVIKQHADGAVYGYIYDAGSLGGSGMNTYAEIPLHKTTDLREK